MVIGGGAAFRFSSNSPKAKQAWLSQDNNNNNNNNNQQPTKSISQTASATRLGLSLRQPPAAMQSPIARTSPRCTECSGRCQCPSGGQCQRATGVRRVHLIPKFHQQSGDANVQREKNAPGLVVSRKGNTPTNVPDRVGNLWLTYDFNPAWQGDVDARYVASRRCMPTMPTPRPCFRTRSTAVF